MLLVPMTTSHWFGDRERERDAEFIDAVAALEAIMLAEIAILFISSV